MKNNNEKIELLRRMKATLLAGTMSMSLVGLSGCAKNVPCDIPGRHAHYYVSDDDLGRYIISEKEYISKLNRTDDYILIDKNDADMFKYINKKGLYKIDDNREAIADITKNQHDFMEYRYRYHYIMLVPQYHKVGKVTTVTYLHIPMTGYSWTTDENRSGLTGETRICHYVYYGYKIVKDGSKTKLVRSELVDDISQLPAEYNYIKDSFYTIVDLNNYEVIDYEDGPEEDKELISEEEYTSLSK